MTESESAEFIQKIGNVLYVVNVKPAEKVKETFENKVRKIIKNEALSLAFTANLQKVQ